jgi:hypothetical protein
MTAAMSWVLAGVLVGSLMVLPKGFCLKFFKGFGCRFFSFFHFL